MIQNKHDSVVDKTSALHTECETLLRDKNELEALANKIESHLQVAYALSTFHGFDSLTAIGRPSEGPRAIKDFA